MPLKSFAQWEAEQRERSTLQSKMEQQVLIDLHMVAMELGRRFQVNVARVEPNSVRLTRADGVSISITSKDGQDFSVLKHPPAESLGDKLAIYDVYGKFVEFMEE